MPSWSAWMIARVNDATSGVAARSASFLSASWRTFADPHLAERERELLGERAFHVLGQLVDRAVEAEARLDGDGEQVERVGQLRADRLPAALDARRDDEARGR